jgi:hypothetical protein
MGDLLGKHFLVDRRFYKIINIKIAPQMRGYTFDKDLFNVPPLSKILFSKHSAFNAFFFTVFLKFFLYEVKLGYKRLM